MEWVEKLSRWIISHKDAITTLAIIIAPIISAVVAYIVAIIGPRTQQKIADQQLRISREQLQFQRQQAEANLFGIYDQKWVERFTTKVAEVLIIATKIQTFRLIVGNKPTPKYVAETIFDLLPKFLVAQNEFNLMIEDAEQAEKFTSALSSYIEIKEDDSELISNTHNSIIKMAKNIIAERLNSINRRLILQP